MKGDKEMADETFAVLTTEGQYTKFMVRGKSIIFLHSMDLIKYLCVKKWDDGYLVVDCLGKIKGRYEDYIDTRFILEFLYMNPDEFLFGVKGVEIQYD